MDIFNILAAAASRFTDPQGTYVRRLSLDDVPYQLRATLYNQDPVIVLVDAEIEQALLSMMGDTTKFREVYATEGVIDWVMFQYHLSVMQHMAPLGWTAPGYRAGGRFPLAVQDICQNLVAHNPFANCHTTSMKDWHKVRHMLTLKRDEGTRIDYVTTVLRALCQYNEMATHSNSEFQQQMLDAALLDYADWAPELENMQESFRTGVPPPNLPSERMEEMERQSREAERDLIQRLDKEAEANARKRERSEKKKDKKARSSDLEEAQPTVALREYKPPSEDDEGVARRLDFDTESQPQQTTVREPNTPEALRTQAAQNPPSSDPVGQGGEAAIDSTEQDPGHAPGPPPQDVDAPERVEEQGQPKESNDQAEKEPEKNSGEGHDSSRQPPDPPEPSDPDDPSQNPDEGKDGEDEEEEDGEGQEEGEGCEEEEEKEVDEEVEVESPSTRKKRKIIQRKEKVDEAAMTRLPYLLAEKGPLYKGVDALPKDKPRVHPQWTVRKGSITQAKDTTPIDHNGNRAFENVRDHQISSIFTLQKHLVDCNKGNREKNSTPGPLRANNGEYSPCRTEMTIIQTDEGNWHYEYSELPGLLPMQYGMKSFDIIEQTPLSVTPKGPHRNLVRQIVEDLDIEVKSKKVKEKVSSYIDDLPPALNPEAIRAARVLIHDVSNHQYDGSLDRGLAYLICLER